MDEWCMNYCDTTCDRPRGHDGDCADGYVTWRGLTDDEKTIYEAEARAGTAAAAAVRERLGI